MNENDVIKNVTKWCSLLTKFCLLCMFCVLCIINYQK